MKSAKIIRLEPIRNRDDVPAVTQRNNAVIENAYRNLNNDLLWSMTMRQQAINERPGYLHLKSLDGTSYYLLVENDGTLRIHTAVPTANDDGDVVGDQTA